MIFGKRAGLILLACAAIIVCAIFARRAHQLRNATNAQRAQLFAQITALTTRIHDTESDLAQAKADWKNEQPATSGSEWETFALALFGRNLAIHNANLSHFVKRLADDPKFLELRNKQIRITVAQDYGPFLAKAHLTPDQTAELMTALVQREMDREDLIITLESQSLPGDGDAARDDPSGIKIKQQIDDAFRQAAEATLDPDAYAQFDAYDRQKTLWDTMGDCAAKSTTIGSPMTRAQVEQLVDYIARNNPDYQNGKAVNKDQIDWPAVNDYARTIMTPDQFDLFTHFSASEAINQKLSHTFAEIAAAGKKQAKGPPN